jgi:hypothetical protein
MQCKDWTLREGDSLELMNKLAPDSVDGVITDPPYCSGGRTSSERQAPPSKKYQTTGSKAYPEFLGDHRDPRGFLAWCSLWLAAAWRATREGGVLVTFIDWRMLPTMTDAVQAGGWIWRGIVPWYKPWCRPQLGRFGLGEQGAAAARPEGARAAGPGDVAAGAEHRSEARGAKAAAGDARARADRRAGAGWCSTRSPAQEPRTRRAG